MIIEKYDLNLSPTAQILLYAMMLRHTRRNQPRGFASQDIGHVVVDENGTSWMPGATKINGETAITLQEQKRVNSVPAERRQFIWRIEDVEQDRLERVMMEGEAPE